MIKAMKKFIVLLMTILCFIVFCGCLGEPPIDENAGGTDGNSISDSQGSADDDTADGLPSECMHIPALSWKNDGAKHWHACIFCEARLEEGAHDVTGIALAAPPTKTSYEEGTSFQSAGMVISATCSVCGEVGLLTGYTVTGGRSLRLTTTYVTVVYGAFSIQVPIEVKPYGGGTWTPEVPL